MLRRSRSFALKERLFYSASLLSVIQLELSADIQYSLINTRALPMPTTGKSLTYKKGEPCDSPYFLFRCQY